MNAQSQPSGRPVFYAGIGASLAQYDVDVDGLTLTRRSEAKLPAGAQYAWQHASKKYLYIASSDTGPGNVKVSTQDTHALSAFRVRPDGALEPHGKSVALRQRPIHITTDADSRHVLVAYNNPAALTVHRVLADGTLGEEIQQAPFDAGVFAHQIRITPSNTAAILVTRGNNATADKPEEPGALKVFKYRDGVLSDEVSVAPGKGFGFGPRHLDFHPAKPWVYVSLERQNKVQLFRMNGDTVEPEPAFSVDTRKRPGEKWSRQWAGTIHVHPNGRFVYGCERCTQEIHGRPEEAYTGGENTIVAYKIDMETGEPALIQHADTRGLHPRTFAIDPSGRMLIAAAKSPVIDKTAGDRQIPASLDVFGIGSDGKLTFVRKYDVDVGNASMFWSGLMQLPAD